MSNGPSVSVIVPYLNAAWCIEEQLSALRGQDYLGPWELILVDNGSVDGSFEVVERVTRDFPVKVTNYRAIEVKGTSYARNFGIDQAKGELLCFCDADDRVDRHWISGLVGLQEPMVLVSGANRSWDGSTAVNQNEAWCSGAKPHLGGPPIGMGCNCLISKSDMIKLGGFDTAFPTGEDAELSWRLWVHGGSVVPAWSAMIDYRERQSFWANFKTQYRHGIDNIRLLDLYRDRLDIDRSYLTYPRWVPPMGTTLRAVIRWKRKPLMYMVKTWGKYVGHLVGMIKRGVFPFRKFGLT